MEYYVYILKSLKTGKRYVGYTENLARRIKEHNTRKTVHTDKTDAPFQLIWHCVFQDKYKALEFEKYLKSGSGRAFASKHLI
jgi:predicted GIY-YIG superfamily endonuclease